MADIPHNIFAELWYCTGGYRTRIKASKRQNEVYLSKS